MDNTALILTLLILFLVALLFFLAYISKSRISVDKKADIYEDIGELKEFTTSESVSERRDVVVKLDNLLSRALQLRYKNNLSTGDNLKTAKTLFRKDAYNRLWEVHKMRNDVVHNDKNISVQDAQEAYKIYKVSITKVLS